MNKEIKSDPNLQFLRKMKEIDDDPDLFDELSEFEELMEEE